LKYKVSYVEICFERPLEKLERPQRPSKRSKHWLSWFCCSPKPSASSKFLSLRFLCL